MAATHPEILVRGGGDNGLVWTTVVSALVHVGAIALVVMAPNSFLNVPRPLESYTVDLVAPNVLGGTNVVPGTGGASKPQGSVPKPPDPAPPEPAVAKPVDNPAPPVPVSESHAVPPAPAPEPVKPVVEAPKAPPPKPAVPVSPKEPAVPKAPEPPSATVKKVAPAEKPKPVPPRAAAKPPAATAEKASAKPAPPQAAEQKPAPPVAAAAKPAAGPADPAQEEARKRDQAILAAVERRKLQAASGASAGSGTGPGAGTGGGPLSVGPGEGAGGTVKGFEYILYYNQMKARIKGSWAWVGAGAALEAVVQFTINPAGEVIGVRTLRSSGDPSYDASVERAIRAASPYGAPPEQYRDEFLKGIEVSFRAEELRS